MSKSVKHLVMLALFTTMALTIFVVEAQIPVPVPIPGVKLGLANVITLIVLVVCVGLIIPLRIVRRVPALREEARRRFNL